MYEEGELDDDVQATCQLVESVTLNHTCDLLEPTKASEETDGVEHASGVEHKSPIKQTSDSESEGWGEGGDWDICEQPEIFEESAQSDQPGLSMRVEKRSSEELAERESVLVLWNKLRWTSQDTWKKVTTRNETPHPLLLKHHISSQYTTTPFNSVHENILLILRLLNE
jgi:hypothetical protein